MEIDSTNSVPTAPGLGNGLEVPARLDTSIASTALRSTAIEIDRANAWTLEDWHRRCGEDLESNTWKRA